MKIILLFLTTLLLGGCAGSTNYMRENFEQIDFKATYEGASAGARIRIRPPVPKTGYEK